MSEFTGTLALTRLALRRDRVQLPVWLVGLSGAIAGNAAGNQQLYNTLGERTAQATLEAGTAVSLVFNGPALGTSAGAVTYVETFSLIGVMVAVMSLLAVIRHTRQNEENGRAEMIGSLVVGRYADLAAALIVTVAANLVLGAVTALALCALGLPVAGSIAAGAGLAGVGVAFAGVAAVAAQVSAFARTAIGLSTAVLGVAFLLRAVGDTFGTVRADEVSTASAWPSWLSPLGWFQQVRPYADNHWAVLVLPVALALLAMLAAFALESHRDFGQGLVGARPGPPVAARGLRSPLGLAWRLQRGGLVAWVVATALLGVGIGAVGNEVEDLLSASDQVKEIFSRAGGGSLTDSFFATTMSLFGIAVGGYLLQSLLRTRAEEAGPLEAVLATSVSRPGWLLSHVACAVAGAVALLFSAGLSTSIAYAVATGDGGQLWRLTSAALVQLPACLALGGFTVAVVGLLPRAAAAMSWAAVASCLVVQQLGGALHLPQALRDMSPYTHVPAVPAVSVNATPLLWTAAGAVVLLGLGLAGFRRRDLSF